jgi:serine/threonine protein kinase
MSGSLYSILHSQGASPPLSRRLCYALDACLGMAYLHRPNNIILHRDLKALNLLVTDFFFSSSSFFFLFLRDSCFFHFIVLSPFFFVLSLFSRCFSTRYCPLSHDSQIDHNGTVKVADFGISRMNLSVGHDEEDYLASYSGEWPHSVCVLNSPHLPLFSLSLSLSLSLFFYHPGSTSWVAPEVFQKKPFTAKCDVYSFGVVLWEILTCEIPVSISLLDSFPSISRLPLSLTHSSFFVVTPIFMVCWYAQWKAINAAVVVNMVCKKHERPPIPESCPPKLRRLIEICWDPSPGTTHLFPFAPAYPLRVKCPFLIHHDIFCLRQSTEFF